MLLLVIFHVFISYFVLRVVYFGVLEICIIQCKKSSKLYL